MENGSKICVNRQSVEDALNKLPGVRHPTAEVPKTFNEIQAEIFRGHAPRTGHGTEVYLPQQRYLQEEKNGITPKSKRGS